MLSWASASFAQNHPELAWQVVETEHFRIFYHEGLDGAAARAARIAEAAYAPITELYGYAPDGRVRIVLKDHDDYANGALFSIKTPLKSGLRHSTTTSICAAVQTGCAT